MAKNRTRKLFAQVKEIASHKIWQELLGLAFILAAGILFLSLISFSTADSPLFSAAPNKIPRNLAGEVGISIASTLYFMLGIAAFFAVAIAFWAGIHQTFHGSLKGTLGIVVGVIVAALVTAAIFDRTLASNEMYFRGGMAGQEISRFLASYLGMVGSSVLFGFIIVGDIVFLFKFSIKDYLIGIYTKVKGTPQSAVSAKRKEAEKKAEEALDDAADEDDAPRPASRQKLSPMPKVRIAPPFIRHRSVGELGKRLAPLVEKVKVQTVVYKRKNIAPAAQKVHRPAMDMIPPFDVGIYEEQLDGIIDVSAMKPRETVQAPSIPAETAAEEKTSDIVVNELPSARMQDTPPVAIEHKDVAADTDYSAGSADDDNDEISDEVPEAGTSVSIEEPAEEKTDGTGSIEIHSPAADAEREEENELIAEVRNRIGLDNTRVETLPERRIRNAKKSSDEAEVTHDLIQTNYDPRVVDRKYKGPSLDILKRSIVVNDNDSMESIKATAVRLEKTLADFDVTARVVGVSRGPVITRYELELEAGTRVSSVVNLTDNIALALASESVRIIAPIPGRSVIGIEIPNKVRHAVLLRDVLESEDFRSAKADIPFVLGKGIYGNNIVADLASAPHLLVAGTTGSGKSVCLSTVILSMLYRFRPDELKFIFIDKKRVELSIYNGIPHLMAPVVSDEKKATVVLRHIVEIMEKRYEKMEKFYVRSVKAYNEKVKNLVEDGEHDFEGEALEFFPYIVVVIDELHNLMIVASKEVEDLISRLAGMSRAVGIHLIIATQRPSADVVTGVIKANLPTRIAFQVPNKMNSRIIIDMGGAEQLLGKGDSLFCSPSVQMPERVQGAFVSDTEVKKVVDEISAQLDPMYDDEVIAMLESDDTATAAEEETIDDVLWEDAVSIVLRTRKASASFLQRRMKIGYNRAARIVEMMEQKGIIGPENGSKPRDVLMADKTA
ncbi:MAG: DNA translocase FtsK 4TM domain-containing protein [Spirochaetota bacterium]